MNINYSLNLSMISRELRLLLDILKVEHDDSIWTLKEELVKDIDWELFLKLAKHHRVYPIIYLKIKKIDEKLIPSRVINILNQKYIENTYRMLRLAAEMEIVSKIFTENHIRLLFLKGPVIAEDIYGDISLRTSKDLDILVPINDISKAEELLLYNGYEREESSAVFDNWRWMTHHVTYFHPQKEVQIEIHWRLHPSPGKEPNFDELWERKRVSTLTTYPVHFFGEEDLFIYLVAHGARHGWFRLRWLVDIDKIIRKRKDKENINLLLKKYLHYNNIGQATILANRLLNTPIPEEMKSISTGKRTRKRTSKIAQLSIFYIVEMGDLEINQYNDNLVNNSSGLMKLNLQKSLVNRYLFSMKSNLQKISFVLQLLYPSHEDSVILKLPKPLYFLYFPLRPFLWAWRKTRRQSV
ncbi:nucleotidyltransferase family protein [Peribacillus sp. TH16]|uniref:nucleotidyltransferase domain-containing protein n=1 Tax=Peribacillus sp. TH16 TaxID=2798482 RepID=UPI001913A095|nr:nucleotidyltransferase family protein [Peribacillus sp. TH16]MBK5484103.1 nucleotidyltransferase family protein [Peribacillus sp. TH16]